MLGRTGRLEARAPDADAKVKYRYYDGCLYMLSLLHLSGKLDLFY